MRYMTLGVLAVWLAAVAAFGRVAAPQPAPGIAKPAVTDGGITVYFSPQGGCTQAVVAEIAQAKATIQVQAYSFTSAEIAKALVDAHKRGVKIVAVLDKSQATAKYSGATFLHNAGIPVLIDGRHAIAHNKIIIIDGQTVITGSFNFTKAAEESNAENLLVIKDRPGLAAAYAANFEKHRQHSTNYLGLQAGRAEPSEDAQEAAQEPAQAVNVAPAVPQVSPKADADVIVHVTRTGKKYHRPGCPSLGKSDIPMRLSEAKAKGYTPCASCRPPE